MMFRNKSGNQSDGPTTADMPETIGAWEMLSEAAAEKLKPALAERYPNDNLAPIARRAGNRHVACFDRGQDGKGKSVVVLRVEGAGGIVRRYERFTEWFDSALADKPEG
jgi:hypothetical protein